MITIEIMGGLGNQLFQIFALLSYSLKYKKPFYFEIKESVRTDRPFYWDNLFKSLRPFLKPPINLPIYKEPHFHYSPIPYIEEPFKLFGYFQSYKYFKEHEDSIIRLLKIRQPLLKPNSVSLHFRIGDYKDLQEHHPLLPIEYYIKALEQLIKDTGKDNWNIIYFFEKKDITLVNKHIDILKSYKNLTFEPIDNTLCDWEQMIKMSGCEHNIIANSSFSWWGAYLNPYKPNVYYPKVWFGPAQGDKKMDDLCPPSWTIIH
jgi:hypothetical protein